jgi:hypothetical protein
MVKGVTPLTPLLDEVLNPKGRIGLKTRFYAPGAVHLRGRYHHHSWDADTYGDNGCTEAHRESA